MTCQKRLVLFRKIYYNYIRRRPRGQAPPAVREIILGRNDYPVKIIDEKGKLFGKLNIVDLLVILLVIAAAVFLVLRQEKNADSGGGGAAATLTYQVLVKGVDPTYYDSVRQFVNPEEGKRDQLLSNNSPIDAYLVDCTATPHAEYINTDDGQVKRVQSEEDKRLDLLFTVEAQVSDLVTNTVGTQQIRVGTSHVLKTIHCEFNTYVISANWETH